jgi:hypothetical protein
MDVEDRPDLNSGQPWPEMCLFDLANCVRLGNSIEEIATFLCRSRREVREKIAELEQSAKWQGVLRRLRPVLGLNPIPERRVDPSNRHLSRRRRRREPGRGHWIELRHAAAVVPVIRRDL